MGVRFLFRHPSLWPISIGARLLEISKPFNRRRRFSSEICSIHAAVYNTFNVQRHFSSAQGGENSLDAALGRPFDARFNYDDQHNFLFLNLSELVVKSGEIIEKFKERIRSIVEPLGHKVYAVVNYDGFELDRDVEDAFVDAVKEVGDRYFHGVTRFATSAFMRAKLGDALGNRGVAPHIYESEEEAKGVLKERSLRT